MSIDSSSELAILEKHHLGRKPSLVLRLISLTIMAFTVGSIPICLAQAEPEAGNTRPSSARPARSPAVAKSTSIGIPRPTSGPRRSPASVITIEQESALRVIGIVPFRSAARIALSPAESAALVALMVRELAAKSYLQARAVESPLSLKSTAPEVQQAASTDKVDGYLVGELGVNEMMVRVVSGRSGRALTTLRIPLDDELSKTSLGNPQTRQTIATRVADQLIETFPYRGFVLQVSERQLSDHEHLVKINLGSRHGMQPGLRMKIFEFANGNFKGERRELGEVEVTKVLDPDESIAKTLHTRGRVVPFTKIGFDDVVVTSVADTRGPSRGWLFVGAEEMNMDSESASSAYADQTYKMSQTPFVSVGLGVKRFAMDMRYGQARNSDYSVGYAEFVGLYKVFDHARGVWDLGGWIGGRVGIFTVTTAPNVVGTLASSTGLSPAFAGSLAYNPNRTVSVFGQLDLYYPVLYSGQDLSFLPYSLSAGIVLGTRIMFSEFWGIEAGARVKSFRRPISGLSSVEERQTSFFGGLIFGF